MGDEYRNDDKQWSVIARQPVEALAILRSRGIVGPLRVVSQSWMGQNARLYRFERAKARGDE